jgi:hypothetical protein
MSYAFLVALQRAFIAVFPPRRAPTSSARRFDPDAARRAAKLMSPSWSLCSAPSSPSSLRAAHRLRRRVASVQTPHGALQSS